MSAIWLPGQGMVSLEGTAVDKAVKAYDERLFFARNAETGYYTVFRHNIRGEDPFPILCFPECPTPEHAIERLGQMDARRRGDVILREVHEANDKAREKSRRDAEEADWIVAEGMESFMHDQGLTPYKRIYRPTKKTAVRGH